MAIGIVIENFASHIAKLVGVLRQNVAQKLAERGVKGVKGNAQFCPLATFFAQEFGVPIGTIEVSGATAGIYGRSGTRVSLGDEFAEFVRRFDRGEFPELEVDLTKHHILYPAYVGA